MRLINSFFLILICFLGSCNNQLPKNTYVSEKIIKNVYVDKNELELNKLKGQWFYKQEPFNGYAVLRYKNDSLSEKTSFYNGKREGEDFKYFDNGAIKRKAYYANNKLQRKKINYLEDGTVISESNYVDGKLDGVQKIWFSNGQLAKRTNFKEGKEEGLQQAWLQNGKIYVNYEAKNGRTFGLQRANLCYQLKNEKVEENKK